MNTQAITEGFISKANILYPKHNSNFTEHLLTLYAKRQYLDLNFICRGNVLVQTHKEIFVSISAFFKTIIDSSSQDVIFVSLPDVDHTTLNLLVNFLYEGFTEVSVSELTDLKEIISMFEITLSNAEIRSTNAVNEVSSSDKSDNVSSNLLNEVMNILSGHRYIKQSTDKVLCEDDVSFVGSDSEDRTQKPSTLSSQDIKFLEGFYLSNQNPKKEHLRLLRKKLNRPTDVILSWFKRKREADDKGSDSLCDVKESVEDTDENFLKISNVFTCVDEPKKDEDVEIQAGVFSCGAAGQDTLEDSDSDCIIQDDDVPENNPGDDMPENNPGFEIGRSDSFSDMATISVKQEPVFDDGHGISFMPVTEGELDCIQGTSNVALVEESPSAGTDEFPNPVIENLALVKVEVQDEIMIDDEEDVKPDIDAINLEVQNTYASLPVENEASYSESQTPKNGLQLSPAGDSKEKNTCKKDNKSDHGHALRAHLNQRQTKILEKEYGKDSSPSKPYCEKIAKKLKIPYNIVNNWFLRRRQSEEHHSSGRRMTKEQASVLERLYSIKALEREKDRLTVAEEMKLPFTKIEGWFQRRQEKDKADEKHQIEENIVGKSASLEQPFVASVLSVRKVETHNYRVKQEEPDPLRSDSPTVKRSSEKKIGQVKAVVEAFDDDKNVSEDESSSDSDWKPAGRGSQEKDPEHDRLLRVPLRRSQREVLETDYNKNSSPTKQHYEKLAEKLNIPYSSVRNWYLKRQSMDETGNHFPVRYRISKVQINTLERMYKTNTCQKEEDRVKIAEELKLPFMRIEYWFKNRQKGDEKECDNVRRGRMANEDISILERSYIKNLLESKGDRAKIAAKIGIPLVRVESWYCRRIRKEPSEHKFKKKRIRPAVRNNLSYEQKMLLQDYYRCEKHPGYELYTAIAKDVGLPIKTVMNWFSNSRRKESSKSEPSSIADSDQTLKQETFVEGKRKASSSFYEEGLAEKLKSTIVKDLAPYCKSSYAGLVSEDSESKASTSHPEFSEKGSFPVKRRKVEVSTIHLE